MIVEDDGFDRMEWPAKSSGLIALTICEIWLNETAKDG